MKENLRIAILMTLVTTVVFGLIYPFSVTGLAQLLFPAQANGSLIQRNGQVVGSQLLGQAFSAPGYFRSRLSAAGTGYDASQSASFNLGPTNQQERGISEGAVRTIVSQHTLTRQFGFLGEPRVRVLELNLDLDATYPEK
jgi:K+-transporting ATPase ATPase C chain